MIPPFMVYSKMSKGLVFMDVTLVYFLGIIHDKPFTLNTGICDKYIWEQIVNLLTIDALRQTQWLAV
jgi:hypothetical protein